MEWISSIEHFSQNDRLEQVHLSFQNLAKAFKKFQEMDGSKLPSRPEGAYFYSPSTNTWERIRFWTTIYIWFISVCGLKKLARSNTNKIEAN